MEVIGLELSRHSATYAWEPSVDDHTNSRITLFSNVADDNIPKLREAIKVWKVLRRLKPNVMAVSGYVRFTSWIILLWARLHHRPVILMSESKSDDAPRRQWLEAVKRLVIRQFSSALCGGEKHRSYLQSLGMPSNNIFLGYDAVGNSFFTAESEKARQTPQHFASMPGLETAFDFFLASARFVPRKNLDGLLRAFRLYLHKAISSQCEVWRLVILGDGIERKYLENLARDLNIADYITFAGFRQINELPAYYGLARDFCSPSISGTVGAGCERSHGLRATRDCLITIRMCQRIDC